MTKEEAIKVLEEFIDDWTIIYLPAMEDAVDVAIEALKGRQQGVWVSQEYDDLKISDYCCSVCGTYRDDKENYCLNCGADMRGDTE